MKLSISLLAVCLAQIVSAAPSIEKRAVSGYNGVANSGVRQDTRFPRPGVYLVEMVLTFVAISGQR